MVGDLAAQPHVTLLARTTAFGCYDGNLVGLLERVADHLPAPPAHVPRQRLWKVRARAIVLASGAHERSIAYASNDLPGTLLAGAAATYVKRYGVRPGARAVVFTNNDSAYASALALHEAGVAIGAIVDARPESQLVGTLPQRARAFGLPIVTASAIAAAHGGKRVAAVDVAPLAGGATRRLECDLVCVSGGWNPAVHLFSQARGKLRYDESLAAFVPESRRRRCCPCCRPAPQTDASVSPPGSPTVMRPGSPQPAAALRPSPRRRPMPSVPAPCARCGACRRATGAISASSTCRTT